MVSKTTSFATAAMIVCGGAAVAAAAAASSSSSSSNVDLMSDPLMLMRASALALRTASAAAVASSSSSFAASSYYLQGGEIAEVARVVVSVGAGAALGVSAYVLALASAPLLVSLPREGSGSLRVAAARCATAVVASAGRASSSMIAF